MAGGAEFVRKPRPVLIVQDDAYHASASVTVCPITSNLKNLPEFRISIAPTRGNGLRLPSQVVADKVTTVARSRLGKKIGVLADSEMDQTSHALILFLGLAR